MDERGVLYSLSKKKELKDNKFLKIWLRKYKQLNPNNLNAFFQGLGTFYQDEGILSGEMDSETLNVLEQDTIPKDLDYRIKRIELSGFRGIPNSDPPYGLEFCCNNEPSNAVVFGNNGTGKSSIYQAIELLFTEKIGEAEFREYDPRNRKRYDLYSNHDNSANDSAKMFKVVTVSGTKTNTQGDIIENGLETGVNYGLCFLSENDIYEMGKTTWDGQGKGVNTIQNAFANKLGLEPFVNILATLSHIINYSPRRKKPDEEGVDDRHKFLKEEIQRLTSRLDILNNDVPGNSSQQESVKTFTSRFRVLEDTNIIMVNEILKCLTETELNIDVLESYDDSINENMIRFLALGLDLIEDYPACPFCEQDYQTPDTIRNDVRRRLQELREENIKINAVYETANKSIDAIRRYNNYIVDIQSDISNELREAEFYGELSEFRDLCSRILSVFEHIQATFIDIKTSDASTLKIQEIHDLIRAVEFELNQIYPATFKELAKLIEDRNKILKELNDGQSEKRTHNEDVDVNIIKARLKLLRDELDLKEQEFRDATHFFAVFDSVVSDSKAIKIIIDETISCRLSNLIEPLKTTLTSVMNDYLKDENYEIQVQFPVFGGDENMRKELSIMLRSRTNGHLIEPARHFNTYRYKLFCFAVNMGLLLAYRKQYSINLPIVIDDAFYSSDYVNIVLFQDTIRKIIKEFSEQTPNLPMQLILFTHDVEIFTSVSNALQIFVQDTILIRLFKSRDATKGDQYMNLGYRLTNMTPHKNSKR